MENLQVHSRSYIVRWVHVSEGHSITWSLQPHKKSLNYGIFKHPGTKNTNALPTAETLQTPNTPDPGAISGTADGEKRQRRTSVVRHDSSNVIEKLKSIGLRCVEWTGNCEADKVSMGTYDVGEGEGGMYGLVFDNTFSKAVAKTATFVLMTHPTNAPPRSKAQLPYGQQVPSPGLMTLGARSPTLRPATSHEKLSDGPPVGLNVNMEGSPRPPQEQQQQQQQWQEGQQQQQEKQQQQRRKTVTSLLDTNDIHTGVLGKKRRKKGQGYAKRFFSLDFTSSTLSYYHDRHSSALRGAIPLSLAAIGADENTREFSVDSGAEVWHLKASNDKEFESWREALERASASATIITPGPATPSPTAPRAPFATGPDIGSREWEKAEQLMGRISGSRDAVRRLAKDTDPKIGASFPGPGGRPEGNNGAPGAPGAPGLAAVTSPGAASVDSATSSANPFFVDNDDNASLAPSEKTVSSSSTSFWKRKASTTNAPAAGPAGLFKRKTSGQQLTVPAPVSPVLASDASSGRPTTSSGVPLQDVHERCLQLLRDLDSVVSDFSALLSETKSRRMSLLPVPISRSESRMSRMSMDSTASDEFFDAEDDFNGDRTPSQLLSIRRSMEDDDLDARSTIRNASADAASVAGSTSSTDSDAASGNAPSIQAVAPAGPDSIFPARPRALSSLIRAPKVQFRPTIPPPKQPPPSLIGFLRKNAGKDLSTVSMPVSANEPLSALQRLAEAFESVSLLHNAASPSLAATDKMPDRLLHVAAFAVTNFAANRVKERAIRKPFNPMLGETYELVRADLGFRFVSEKVCHRPVRMAWQADSIDGSWSVSQAAQPTQKFWGKSAELNTEGKCRLVLHSSGEHYSWTLATAFLRNIIAGEKYIEPVANMTVLNETTGARAVATFKAAGLWSGRSEDVTIAVYAAGSQDPLPQSVTGKWTQSLTHTDSGNTIWTAGPLVPDASKIYGFTAFAACLNELRDPDKKVLPHTDSRLRPDQRAWEEGKLDHAEALKAKLEERQRARRKVLETHGAEWKPVFFERIDGPGAGGGPEGTGEEVYRLKAGKDGYWECRSRGEWGDLGAVFET